MNWQSALMRFALKRKINLLYLIKINHKCENKYLEKRTDDNSKTILNRYETYVAKTKSILDYYKKKKLLLEIDGNQEIAEIYHKIKGFLENIRD